MDDDTFTTEATGEANPLPSENGEGNPLETGQDGLTTAPPPPQTFLSREDLEQFQREQDARWQAQLRDVESRAQAKADKARDAAIRKANAFETETVQRMKEAGVELEPEQIAAVKAKMIETEFWTPEPAAATSAQAAPQAPYVTRGELVGWLATQGMDASAIDLSKYENQPRGDAQLEAEFLDDVALAKAKQVEAKRRTQQQRAEAQKAGAVKQQFGGVASPTRAAPTAGADPEQRIKKLQEQGPPGDSSLQGAYYAEIDKLEAELQRSGRWD